MTLSVSGFVERCIRRWSTQGWNSGDDSQTLIARAWREISPGIGFLTNDQFIVRFSSPVRAV